MGGMPIRQPLPTQKVQQVDPFLLLHHANIKAPTHVDPDDAGVGPHPHRGFSPVTFFFREVFTIAIAVITIVLCMPEACNG